MADIVFDLDKMANDIGLGNPIEEAEHRRVLNDAAQEIRTLRAQIEPLRLVQQDHDNMVVVIRALYEWYDESTRSIEAIAKIVEEHRDVMRVGFPLPP